MPRIILLLVLAILPLMAGTTCLGQEVSSKARPVPTFEDSVRAALVDGRNHYQATARMLESLRSHGYIVATLGVVSAAGAIALGASPVIAVYAVPGVLGGILLAAEAGALRRVMQGQVPFRERRKMLDRDDY